MSCGAYQCATDGVACRVACGTESDCASGNFCRGGTCTPKLANGTSCNSASECQAGNCVGNICCNRTCNGTCETCGTGTCTARTPAKVGSDLRVTTSPNLESGNPNIVSTGTSFGLAWQEGIGPIAFRRISSDGAFTDLSATTVAAQGEGGYRPGIVWTGARFVVVWGDTAVPSGYAILGRAVALDGSVTVGAGEIARLADRFYNLATVWHPNRAEVGVAWGDPMLTSFTRANEFGAGQGGTKIASQNPATSVAIAVAPPDGPWAVAWNQDSSSGVFVTRLDALGNRIGMDTFIGLGSSPTIAWSGSEFGITWACPSGACFARMSPQGMKVGMDQLITPGFTSAGLIWNGDRWITTWIQAAPMPEGVFVGLLDATGAPAGGSVAVTSHLWGSERPRSAWASGSIGVTWSDRRDGNFEIYFARLRCD